MWNIDFVHIWFMILTCIYFTHKLMHNYVLVWNLCTLLSKFTYTYIYMYVRVHIYIYMYVYVALYVGFVYIISPRMFHSTGSGGSQDRLAGTPPPLQGISTCPHQWGPLAADNRHCLPLSCQMFQSKWKAGPCHEICSIRLPLFR